MGNDRYHNHLQNNPNDNIDVESLPGYENRLNRGDFNKPDGKVMSNDEIIDLYRTESIEEEHDDALQEHNDRMNAMDD